MKALYILQIECVYRKEKEKIGRKFSYENNKTKTQFING